LAIAPEVLTRRLLRRGARYRKVSASRLLRWRMRYGGI